MKKPPGLRFLEFCFLPFVLFFLVFNFFLLLQRFFICFSSFKFARCSERLPFGGLSIPAVHSFSANLTMLHHYFKFIYKAEYSLFL
jgi:hypothetical protein